MRHSSSKLFRMVYRLHREQSGFEFRTDIPPVPNFLKAQTIKSSDVWVARQLTRPNPALSNLINLYKHTDVNKDFERARRRPFKRATDYVLKRLFS